MRTYTFVSIWLATILFCNEYVAAGMHFFPWNRDSWESIAICRDTMCFTPDKCEQNRTTHDCFMPKAKGFVCCSVVKPEYRTHCHHYGGECRNKCASREQPHAGECWDNKICCGVFNN